MRPPHAAALAGSAHQAPAAHGQFWRDPTPRRPWQGAALAARLATHASTPAALGGLLLLLAALALLLAFEQVVRLGVLQGESRRRAVAEHERAVWQCSDLPQRQAAEQCRQLLKAVAPPGAAH